MKNIAILILLLSGSLGLKAQDNPEKTLKKSNSYIYEAQEALAENDFVNAEAEYRKAVAKDPSNTSAKYNMGNLYYGKEKSVTAKSRLKEAAEVAGSKEEKHKIFHNLGNSYMQQKEYQEAVDAFKNALRNNPTDEETRYNLALAKKMLEKEQQNQDDQQDDKNGGEDENENKDQQEQDQNKDGEGGEDEDQNQQPKDEGENEKDKQEGENQEDKEQQEGDEKEDEQGKGDEPEQKQPQPAQGQLSPQQIKSLLEAMNNEEKKVQDKINAEKAKGVKVKSEKDW